MKPKPTDRERVEQIRESMQITLSGGKKLIVRTHKNFIACELLEYIDKLTIERETTVKVLGKLIQAGSTEIIIHGAGCTAGYVDAQSDAAYLLKALKK